MSYLNVKNPVAVDIASVYKGEEFSIKAGKTESFPDDMVTWLVGVYPFLEVVEMEKPTITKVKEEVKKKVVKAKK